MDVCRRVKREFFFYIKWRDLFFAKRPKEHDL